MLDYRGGMKQVVLRLVGCGQPGESIVADLIFEIAFLARSDKEPRLI